MEGRFLDHPTVVRTKSKLQFSQNCHLLMKFLLLNPTGGRGSPGLQVSLALRRPRSH